MNTTPSPIPVVSQAEDKTEAAEYEAFLQLTRERVDGHHGPFFTTNVSPEKLWAAYLSNVPRAADPARKQHYNCNCCRRFVQKYGGLVTIVDNGTTSPLCWGPWASKGVPSLFGDAVVAMRELVRRATVTGVFTWDKQDRDWGQAKTGEWTHLSGSQALYNTDLLKTAGQVMAEKKQDFEILDRALGLYKKDVAAQAVRLLQSDQLAGAERTLPNAEWFLTLHKKLDGVVGRAHNNVIWLAVAKAPAGWCHVTGNMLSTLMDSVTAGDSLPEIKRKWDAKMGPLNYMRPKAAPTEGAIQRAETIVARLDIAAALNRRFATLDDVQVKLWLPHHKDEESLVPRPGEVFGRLKKEVKPSLRRIDLAPVKMTWDKFRRMVLPVATTMEAHVSAADAFYGLVTAADPEANPIIQWDGLEGQPRNPVSWYFYSKPSPARNWGMTPNTFHKVTAVFLSPYCWHNPDAFKTHGDRVFFSLEGCWDRNAKNAGLGLFPSIMKSELHEVRSVIEAHSAINHVTGAEASNANGVALQRDKTGECSPVTIRVNTPEGAAVYVIDRWD